MTKRTPIIGCSWDPEFRNPEDNMRAMADELDYYRPRGFAKLRDELRNLADAGDPDCLANEVEDEAADLLTEWARRILRHDYVYWSRDGGFAGFAYAVDSALEDADWRYSDNGSREEGNPHQPGDGAGLEIYVNDHGNITAWIYGNNGHKREIFAVV